MAGKTEIEQLDVVAWLKQHEDKDLLRFLTCGSVDDGKSTLIGRLLYNSKMIYEDQLASFEEDNQRHGHAGQDLDFALLVDGLAAEREQGITIDVAWRYFSTENRKFIIADTPGHEQYTRNMATGASACQLAIILVDARKGILDQTRRHSLICNLLGIKQLIIAVNKMDLKDWSQDVYEQIKADYLAFAAELENFEDLDIQFAPISALKGDNITESSTNMAWYKGLTLLGLLENATTTEDYNRAQFRFPVQYVNRPDIHFRGFAGTIANGEVSVGDEVLALPSGRSSKVARIVTMDGDLQTARYGQAVTLTLEDEIDISRGDMLAFADQAPSLAREVQADIVWMQDDPLKTGHLYRFRFATAEVQGVVKEINYKLNINSLTKLEGEVVGLNEIARITVELTTLVPLDTYRGCRETGSFIIVDRLTNATAGAAMVARIGRVHKTQQKASNIVWHNYGVNKQARAELKSQKPLVLWFTGLSGSGKSTVANVVEQRLFNRGKHTYLLDGDNVRHGLNKNLSFAAHDRVENIRRVAEVSKLMTDAGLVVLATFISPFRSDRHIARELFEENEFVEVYIDTPLEICEQRDPKGLYQKARKGEIADFTGISSPYEAPQQPEIHVKTAEKTPEECADVILTWLEKYL